MPINRMVLLNANTVILLKWVLLFLRMHPCLMTLSKVPPRIGTPSAECCSKSFPHEETRGLYRTLGEQSKKLSSFFVKQRTKQFLCLVSPTPPSGCQAQGVSVSKINMICNKINNNAISKYDAGKVFLGFVCECKKVNMFFYFRN
jgi:hypothetical protein